MSKELVEQIRARAAKELSPTMGLATKAADLIERQDKTIEGLEQLVIDAYARGVEWCEENPLDREYRYKAAQDYLDYELHARSLTTKKPEE